MTFCIGLRVAGGVVTLADTRIVRGSETSRKSKLTMLTTGNSTAAVMTSGLRSVRDKTVTRLRDELTERPIGRMHELATAFGEMLRVVRADDGDALAASGLAFNTHAVIAGRLDHDAEPGLFHVFPEGNWVESTVDEPYFVIGRSSYGKPILDRLLTYESDLDRAITLAYLAFDATRTSATDVDFPIDLAVLDVETGSFSEQRLTREGMQASHDRWNAELGRALDVIPAPWNHRNIDRTQHTPYTGAMPSDPQARDVQ